MRICPNCGYHDHPMWRPRRSRVFAEYTKAETLEYNDPKLFALIKEAHPNIFSDGHFTYKITRGGNVERIETEYYKFMGMGKEPQEKVDHSLLAMATPLTEFMKEDPE